MGRCSIISRISTRLRALPLNTTFEGASLKVLGTILRGNIRTQDLDPINFGVAPSGLLEFSHRGGSRMISSKRMRDLLLLVATWSKVLPIRV